MKENNLLAGFGDMMTESKAKRDALRAKLESLSASYETFDQEELQALFDIKKAIDSMNDIDEIISYLDNQEIWRTKFSTGGKESANDDSIYYLSPSNISLRLKRVNLNQGLRKATEPFMESCVFDDGPTHPKITPAIGLNPSEYLSKEFYDLQQSGVAIDFVSKVPRFYEEGELFYQAEPEHLEHNHPGNPVNHIFFLRD